MVHNVANKLSAAAAAAALRIFLFGFSFDRKRRCQQWMTVEIADDKGRSTLFTSLDRRFRGRCPHLSRAPFANLASCWWKMRPPVS